MELVKKIFDCVGIYKLKSRTDNRGGLTYAYEDDIPGFEIKETRVYTMPQKGTFFGIHYSDNTPFNTGGGNASRGRSSFGPGYQWCYGVCQI